MRHLIRAYLVSDNWYQFLVSLESIAATETRCRTRRGNAALSATSDAALRSLFDSDALAMWRHLP